MQRSAGQRRNLKVLASNDGVGNRLSFITRWINLEVTSWRGLHAFFDTRERFGLDAFVSGRAESLDIRPAGEPRREVCDDSNDFCLAVNLHLGHCRRELVPDSKH